MSELKICRVCLCQDVKMYSYNDYKLNLYYEEVLTQNVIDGLPLYFCYTCAAMLYKFHKFKEKCQNGQETLKELICANGDITFHSVSQVDKETKKLKSNLSILTDSHRVNTCSIVYKSIDFIKSEDEEESRHSNKDDSEYDGDNILEYNLEIKNEQKNIVDEQKLNADEEKINIDKEKIPLKIEEIYTQDPLFNDRLVTEKNNRNLRKNIKNISSVKSENKEKIKKYSKKKDKIPNKAKNVIKDKPKQRKKFMPSKTRHLDPEHWLKITLSDIEAMENFKSKSFSPTFLKATYKCEKCYTPFSKEDMMVRHMSSIHCEARGSYECAFCCRRFKTKSRLTTHLSVHYNKYKCLRCDQVFHVKDSARSHNEVHSGVIRQCKHCGQKFRNRKEREILRVFVFSTSIVVTSTCVCTKCNKYRRDSEELKDYLIVEHKLKGDEFQPIYGRHITTYYSHLRLYHRSEHVCTLCGASFVSEKGLQQHKNKKHLNIHIKSDDVKGANTHCERCDIKFETFKAYEEHFNQSDKHADHQTMGDTNQVQIDAKDTQAPISLKGKTKTKNKRQNVTRITCPVCNKVFPSYYRYVKHHRSEHKGLPITPKHTHVCEICGATIRGYNITSHMNIHTKEKAYSCDTCGVHFYHLSSLGRHQLTHTGEKPYKCPLCDKRFTQKNSMQLHHRTFHLKEPYPKRTRRKKNIESQEIPLFEDFSEDSKD